MNSFYLTRTLINKGVNYYSETELLEKFKFIIVLAEPGAGKTELLKSLARQLNTDYFSANYFRFKSDIKEGSPIIIDSFDELSKINSMGIVEVLSKAAKAKPELVVIASRSSEWNLVLTNEFQNLFGSEPEIFQLVSLSEVEQKKLFEVYKCDQNFDNFKSQLGRFELANLLSNPQFLILFADAYVQECGQLTNKSSIFESAIKQLAKEANSTLYPTVEQLNYSKKVEIASEIFAKLLLSGSEGLCISEADENPSYPFYPNFVKCSEGVNQVISTRLFKPLVNVNQLVPAHKIISEYCAAKYLVKRIQDPIDFLTIKKCLAIIAPNLTVRIELRGMLGWMASLGSQQIQDAVIGIDPYSVLANGDPSQLTENSKILLMTKLEVLSNQDPYFRGSDFWRNFSVVGFFTSKVLEAIGNVLTGGLQRNIKNLYLELLASGLASNQIDDVLTTIVLDKNEHFSNRLLAGNCLIKVNSTKLRSILKILVDESTVVSLKISAKIIEKIRLENLDFNCVIIFLRSCSTLYTSHKNIINKTYGERLFVKEFISTLNLVAVIQILEELTTNLNCVCNQVFYNCECRIGISKVVGTLLDQYFELASTSPVPEQIWRWTKNLFFDNPTQVKVSKSISELQQNTILRQSIFSHALINLTDKNQINNVINDSLSGYHSHSGIKIQEEDKLFLIDLAFEHNNIELWSNFITPHSHSNSYSNFLSPHRVQIRRKMRNQAKTNEQFMLTWVEFHNNYNQVHRQTNLMLAKLSRNAKKRKARLVSKQQTNQKEIQDNLIQIREGKSWLFLSDFAWVYLKNPEDIEEKFGDATLVNSALSNCIELIESCVPSLQELAKTHATSRITNPMIILYAACLTIMRTHGSLASVKNDLLLSLRTIINFNFKGVTAKERLDLENEIDLKIFQKKGASGTFIRNFFEPQLLNPVVDIISFGIIEQSAFDDCRTDIIKDWLIQFNNLPILVLGSLFDLAVRYVPRDQLQLIISDKCLELQLTQLTCQNRDLCIFWYIRHFFFIEEIKEIYLTVLTSNTESIFLFSDIHHDTRREANWPALSAIKVEKLLDTFINQWPKVELPSYWSSESPKEDTAYRFLKDVTNEISLDTPDRAIPVLNRLVLDCRYKDFLNELKSTLAYKIRQKSHLFFKSPSLLEIGHFLDNGTIATVQLLREKVLAELELYQKEILGSEFNISKNFYDNNKHKSENDCTEIIAYRLSVALANSGESITIEHQLKDRKRSDFTVCKVTNTKHLLLTTEVKGQWHSKLFNAAEEQLYKLYAIHPDADNQGMYIILWFGASLDVNGKLTHGIKNADELKRTVEDLLTDEIKSRIDIFVLDLSGENT